MRDVAADELDSRVEGQEKTTGVASSNNNPNNNGNPIQGNYVVPFDMTLQDQEASIASARAQLNQLMAECCEGNENEEDPALDDDLTSTNKTATGKWTRVKFKSKKTRKMKHKTEVQVWEKKTRHTASGGSDFSSCSSQMYAVRSSVTVKAPLETVLKALDCSVVSAYRSFTKIIYENLVADTSVLFSSSTSQRGTPAADIIESLAVRWLVCRCNNAMVSDCDLCLMEYTKVHTIDELLDMKSHTSRYNNNSNNNNRSHHNQERRHSLPSMSSSLKIGSSRKKHGFRAMNELPIAYKILRSMETKFCPELVYPFRLARCHVPLGGFLFYPTDNSDVTDVVFYMSVVQDRQAFTNCGAANFNSAMSFQSTSDRQFRAIQQVLQQMALRISRLGNAVDAYAMSLRLEELRNTRWVRNDDRMECVVCYRRFHPLTRRKHHCRLCGDVICRDCSVHKDADLPTIGPTVLRICKLCDADALKASATSSTSAGSASTAAARSLFSSAFETTEAEDVVSPVLNTFAEHLHQRNRSTTISAKPVARADDQYLPTGKVTPGGGRRFTTVVDNRQQRGLTNQPAMSCPKASNSIDQRYLTSKWDSQGGRFPYSPIISPASTNKNNSNNNQDPTFFSQPTTPTAADFHAKSCSKASSKDRARFHFTRDAPVFTGQENDRKEDLSRFVVNRNDASDEDDESHDQFARQPVNLTLSKPTIQAPHVRTKSLPLDSRIDTSRKGHVSFINTPQFYHVSPMPHSDSKEATIKTSHNNNQQVEHLSQFMLRRSLANVERYEDILQHLCEEAARSMGCQYAAVSIFTCKEPIVKDGCRARRMSWTSKMDDDDTSIQATHFLKAEDGKKLMKVAANLMCCEPILELKEPIITQNTLASSNRYDFRKLPFVIGPQQVRFYAGIPLVDAKNKLLGALAVFDGKTDRDFGTNELNHMLASLDGLTSIAIEAIDERRQNVELKSFLGTPLVHDQVRQSEPVLNLTLTLQQQQRKRAAVSDAGSSGGNEMPQQDEEELRGDKLVVYHHHRSSSYQSQFPQQNCYQSPSSTPSQPSIEYYKNKMQQLVRQAQETQVQMMQNSIAMKRQGVFI